MVEQGGLSGGAVTNSQSESYSQQGTFGEPVAGPSESANYMSEAGANRNRAASVQPKGNAAANANGNSGATGGSASENGTTSAQTSTTVEEVKDNWLTTFVNFVTGKPRNASGTEEVAVSGIQGEDIMASSTASTTAPGTTTMVLDLSDDTHMQTWWIWWVLLVIVIYMLMYAKLRNIEKK